MDKKTKIELTEKVMRIVKRVYNNCANKSISIDIKGKSNFVTNVDKEIERELIRELTKLLPNAGVICEETGEHNLSDYNWVIDPIDGTTNFIFGYSYSVSVALVKGKNHEGVLGVVYCPVENEFYYGIKGCGSYEKKNGIVKKLHKKSKIRDEGILLFGMPYDHKKSKKILNLIYSELENFSDIKRIGPASVDICRVAKGIAKKYMEYDLKLWDIAAGLIILKEAGGSYKKQKDLLIFTN